MNEPVFSIIVPAFNCARYIGQLIDSIRTQSYTNFEVIIVDDGSTDYTAKIIDSIAQVDERFRVYHTTNSGQSAARKFGLDHSQGKYITFADSDDIVSNNWLATILSDFSDSRIDIVNVNYAQFTNKLNLKNDNDIRFKAYIIGQEKAYNEWMADKFLKGFLWNKTFKADIIKQSLHPLSFNFLEDSYIVLKSLKLIQNIYMEPKVLYFYRNSKGSAVNSKIKERDLGCITSIRFELMEICKKKYPALNDRASVRIAKIELFLLSRMDFKQFKSNMSMVNDFKKRINESNDEVYTLFNRLELFLIRDKRNLKYLFVNLKIREYLIAVKTNVTLLGKTLSGLKGIFVGC